MQAQTSIHGRIRVITTASPIAAVTGALKHDPNTVTLHNVGIRLQMLILRFTRIEAMDIDTDKLDAAALAILSLTLHDDARVWKGIDWEITDRLNEKGLIENPANRAKSLVLTARGLESAKAALEELFSKG